MDKFKIRTIDFKSVNAPLELVDSLRNTGFAIIRNHGIDKKLINGVYNEWSDFFKSDFKNDYIFDIHSQDGYFPMKSENAHGYDTKDLKEFYHIYLPWGRIPSEISEDTVHLRNRLLDVATVLLDWIDENTPNEIREGFSIPLNDMIKESQNNLLRVIHYPPLRESDDQKALRAAAHGDINLITVLLSGSEPGLEVLNIDREWVPVDSSRGWLVINSGDMLNKCSGGFYPSTIHRVVNPTNKENRSRYSMPLFLHPRDEVVLNEKYTARSYLEKRLRALGLK